MAQSIHSVTAPLTAPLTLSHSESTRESSLFPSPPISKAFQRTGNIEVTKETPSHNESSPPPSRFFSKRFHQKGDPELTKARAIYLKSYIIGLFTVIVAIFAIFPIYWGSLWKVPAHPLPGWIVDLDGGNVGLTVTQQLTASPNKYVQWKVQPASRFPNGQSQVAATLVDEQNWVAITINEGVSARLANSIASPDPLYNGSDAITVYAAEARNENAYRVFIRPFLQTSLDSIQEDYATRQAVNLSTATSLGSLMSVSPQTVVTPVSYTIVNILPFNQSVASAVTFVGLIYLLILSFFVVVVAYGAREASGFNQLLQYKSLVHVRLVTAFIGYFFLSLFYSLLSVAFQIDLTVEFGRAGFMVFWMLNWVGMLSVGLALESVITILTPRFIPFFMLLLIIVNVSVCVYPIDMLPRIYRYGYAMPFYNISQSARTIVFGVKNRVGQNFGVLIAWVAISCFTLILFQWTVRKRDISAERKERKSKMRAGTQSA